MFRPGFGLRVFLASSLVACLLSAAPSVRAQVDAGEDAGTDAGPVFGRVWTSLASTTLARPAARVAFDRVGNQLLRFGGQLGPSVGADDTGYFTGALTSALQGGKWVLVGGGTEPPARSSHALATEPAGTVLLFGGENASSFVRRVISQ